MSDLKSGDTVMLKSGGPIMTIDTVGDYGGVKKALCQWFEKQKLENGMFPLTSLVKDE